MNFKKIKLNIKIRFKLLISILMVFNSNCTFVYKPEVKNDEIKINSNHQQYRGYESVDSDILKDKYLDAMIISRTKYIEAVSKAEELGINKSSYLDSCCNQIRIIDSILNENSAVKYCDSIKKVTF